MPGGRWWWTTDREIHDGEFYAYVIDDEGPFPDPRSPFQPLGVHGWSQCVDHSLFQWTCKWAAPPLAAGIIYELPHRDVQAHSKARLGNSRILSRRLLRLIGRAVVVGTSAGRR